MEGIDIVCPVWANHASASRSIEEIMLLQPEKNLRENITAKPLTAK